MPGRKRLILTKGFVKLQARARAAAARKKYSTRRKPNLARFGPSVKQYNLNRMVSSAVRGIAETKLISITDVNEQVPLVSINPSAPNSRYLHFILGSTRPSGWDPQAILLNGTAIAQGTNSQQRTGSYVYLKKTTLMVDIDMAVPPSGVYPPIEFRALLLKPKRYALQSGVTLGPQAGMFINSVGGEIGYNSVGYNSTDFARRPVNKRNFKVYRDQRFMLSAPSAIPNAEGYTGKYGCMKSFRLTLPHYKKVKYDASGNPYDIDTHYSLIVFARAIAKDHVPDNWEMNIRGTTSFSDL